MRKDVHVMPDGEGWKISGSDKQFGTQQEAEEAGRRMAQDEEAEFFVHGRDGKIRERDSYGNDPRDIPG